MHGVARFLGFDLSQPVLGIDPGERDIINEVIAGLNSIAMTAVLGAVITYCLIWIMNRKSADRISLRLSMYICLADMLFHQVNIWGVDIFADTDPWQCKAYTFGYVMFDLLSIFFTVCIAIHLQITFLSTKVFASFHQKLGLPLIERLYVFGSVTLSAAIASVPLFFDMYGWNTPEITRNIIYQWTTLYIWMIVGSLYCAYVVVRVVLRIRSIEKSLFNHGRVNSDGDMEVPQHQGQQGKDLRRRSNQSLETTARSAPMGTDHAMEASHTSLNERKTAEELHRSTVRVQLAIAKRLTAFSIIPLFTQLFSFVGETEIHFVREVKYEILMLEGVCTGIQGLLDAAAFSTDTSVWTTFAMIRRYLVERFVTRYEQDIADREEPLAEHHGGSAVLHTLTDGVEAVNAMFRGEVTLKDVETRLQRFMGWFMHGFIKVLFVKTLGGAILLQEDDHVVGVENM
ncbi:hypothetical protein RI367_002788 [Sorochytrium milnesiophthora]